MIRFSLLLLKSDLLGEMIHSYYKKGQTIQKSTKKKLKKNPYLKFHHLEIICLTFCEFCLGLVTGIVRRTDEILPYVLFYLKV